MGGERNHAIAKTKKTRRTTKKQTKHKQTARRQTNEDRQRPEQGKRCRGERSYRRGLPKHQTTTTKTTSRTTRASNNHLSQNNTVEQQEKGAKNPDKTTKQWRPKQEGPRQTRGRCRQSTDIPNHVANHPAPRSQTADSGSRGRSRDAKRWGTKTLANIWGGTRHPRLDKHFPKHPDKNNTKTHNEKPLSTRRRG